MTLLNHTQNSFFERSVTYFETLSNFIKNNENKIAGVAYAILATLAQISSGGTVTPIFFVAHLLSGTFSAFIIEGLSFILIDITASALKLVYRGLDPSTERRLTFHATLNYIKNLTYYKTCRSVINIFSTIGLILFKEIPLRNILRLNLAVTSSIITIIALSLKLGWVSRNAQNTYTQYIGNQRYDIGNQRYGYGNHEYYTNNTDDFNVRAKAKTSILLIKTAITNYRERFDEKSEKRKIFDNNLEALEGEVFIILARESLLCILDKPIHLNYPSFILSKDIPKLKEIHKVYSELSQAIKNEIKKFIHSDSFPTIEIKKIINPDSPFKLDDIHKLWTNIRGFEVNLTKGNSIFNVAIEETLK